MTRTRLDIMRLLLIGVLFVGVDVVESEMSVGMKGFEHVMPFGGVNVAAFKYHPCQVILIGGESGVLSNHGLVKFSVSEFENKLKRFRNNVVDGNDGDDSDNKGEGHFVDMRVVSRCPKRKVCDGSG